PVAGRQVKSSGELHPVLAFVGYELFFDPRQLRRRVLELSERALCSGGNIANKIVRRFSRRFIFGEQHLRVVAQRRDYRLVCFLRAAKEPLGLKSFEVEPIDEWPVAVGRGTLSGQENVIAVLKNQSAASKSPKPASATCATVTT